MNDVTIHSAIVKVKAPGNKYTFHIALESGVDLVS
jgi:hypothetical protein